MHLLVFILLWNSLSCLHQSIDVDTFTAKVVTFQFLFRGKSAFETDRLY